MPTSATEILNREIPSTLDWMSRLRLSAGIIICFCLFWYGGQAINLPAVFHKGGSLMSQPQPSVAIGAVLFGLLICTFLARFIVGYLPIGPDLQFDGGLLASLLGMFAIVFRLGPVSYALFYMDDPKAFILLAAELILLYVVVGFCWIALQWAAPTVPSGPPESVANKLGAVAVHIVVMTACMLFLSKSDAPSQALAAVGISALLASLAAHIAFPIACSAWYWIGPVIVGLVGYGIAFVYPDGLATGYPTGMFGALALPTPLAYAAAGPAGAIFGYWVAHRWHHEAKAQG